MTEETQSYGAACVTREGELRAFTRKLGGMATFRVEGNLVARIPEAPQHVAVGAHDVGSQVTCFAQTPGVDFFGTNRGLLVHADFCQSPFRMGSPNRRITALCVAGDGTLFAGTSSVDGSQMVLFSAFRAQSGRAPERSLTLGVDRTFRAPRDRLSDDRAVRAIFTRPDAGHGESLVVAGDDGVFERGPSEGAFRELWSSTEALENGGIVYCGHATPDGRVFLGRESGLWVGDDRGGWRPLPESPRRVTALLQSGNELFFASTPPRVNASEVWSLGLLSGDLMSCGEFPWFSIRQLLSASGRLIAFGDRYHDSKLPPFQVVAN